MPNLIFVSLCIITPFCIPAGSIRSNPAVLKSGTQKLHAYFESHKPSIIKITVKTEEILEYSDRRVLPKIQANFIIHVKRSSIQIKRKSVAYKNRHRRSVFDARGFKVQRNGGTNDTFVTVGVPTGNVYGFGEQFHQQLRHSFNNTRLSFFNHDHYPAPNNNLYGFHPFYMGLDAQNKTYGVYFNTTYPMEALLTTVNGKRLVKFHALGGDIDFYVFMGPKPDQVIQQYTSVIGRPFFPPYWSLGFHLSRYGYKNLDDLKKVWYRNRAAYIPQDGQTIDIDYMNKLFPFTYDKTRFAGLPEFTQSQIHGSGRKLVLIQEPVVGYETKGAEYLPLTLGRSMRVFIKNTDKSSYYNGTGWPGQAYWIDYTHPNASAYWTQLFEKFHQQLPFDGAWLDMNDPSIFVTHCAKNSINNPLHPVVPYSPFYDRTVCPDAMQFIGSHLQWHNYYSFFEAKATAQALDKINPGKRQFILSRSTSPGSGQYTSHWSGDNRSDWDNMRQSIIALLEFNMFGIPFMGTDICGFGGNTNEELCLRWSQLGAFYTYSRNHNDMAGRDQDPAVWQANTTAAIRGALQMRYFMLPYLNTLMFKAHMTGSTVARPLFFEFPDDANTWNLYSQFLWGSNFMIVPILEPYATQRSAYFPANTIWYNFYDLNPVVSSQQHGLTKQIHIAKNEIGLFLRAGSILPNQMAAETTAQSRRNNFEMVVALNPINFGDDAYAQGDLFWDDGESATSITTGTYCFFTFASHQNRTGGSVELSVKRQSCSIPDMSMITVAGVKQRPTVIRTGAGKAVVNAYNATSHVLIAYSMQLQFTDAILIQWQF